MSFKQTRLASFYTGQIRPVRAKMLIPILEKEQNPLKMKMRLLAYMTARLEKRKQSLYLVGGQAVETYTAGEFTTGDIDVTTTDRALLEKLLASLGFTRHGMIWLHEKLGVAVHVVGLFPPLEKAQTIRVGQYPVRIIGIEDLILDRLMSVKVWKVSSDLERAQALFSIFHDRLDTQYLEEKARKKHLTDTLQKIMV